MVPGISQDYFHPKLEVSFIISQRLSSKTFQFIHMLSRVLSVIPFICFSMWEFGTFIWFFLRILTSVLGVLPLFCLLFISSLSAFLSFVSSFTVCIRDCIVINGINVYDIHLVDFPPLTVSLTSGFWSVGKISYYVFL